jgi:Kef-type K+ transport system membrane component KefB
MMILAAGALSPADITVFLLSLGLLLGLARLLGEVARALGQPVVLGEIIAGVLLGSTVLANLHEPTYDWLFPSSYDSNVRISLDMFLSLSAAMLLLVAGLEVDLSVVRRQGKAAFFVSMLGMLVPFAFGFALAWFLPNQIGFGGEPGSKLPFALFVGIAMSITALPVIAKILMDLNMFKSDIGMLIMSSAMVNDLLGWIGFAVVLAMVAASLDPAAGDAAGGSGLYMTLFWTLLFVGGMLTVGRWIIHRILPWIQAHSSWPGGTIGFVLVVALLCAALTEWIGIHSIFGAFIAGVAIGDSHYLKARTRDTIHQFITSIFAPVFFAGIALRVSFVDDFNLLAVVLVLVIAILGKLIGCYIGGVLAGLGKRESMAIGFGMTARGAMEIILAQLALEYQLIDEDLFVAIVIMAIATSLLAGPAMQRTLKQKQKRKLADLVTNQTFLVKMQATDRHEAIAELGVAAATAAKRDADQVIDAVWKREQMQATGLPDGIAVPHARLQGLDKPIVAVGLTDRGIDFDSPDGQPARIICLLLTDQDDQVQQLELLSTVAEAFSTAEARDTARDAESLVQFKAALTTSEPPAEH